MRSVRADGPFGANMADRRPYPLRRSRIHGRMFLRNVDIALLLRAADETSIERGANSAWARLAYQKSFVGDASAREGVADTASEFVGMGTPVVCSGTRTAGCMVTSREARTAASIASRTLPARRVRFTNGRSTLTPVMRTRDAAVGPSASSSSAHTTPMIMKIAPEVEFTQYQKELPTPANNTPGIISRSRHERLGQTKIDSKSRK